MSAIDLAAWLNSLSANDREMLELRAAGFTLEETGEKLGVSTSCVFARCRELGAELAERMGVAVGRKAGARCALGRPVNVSSYVRKGASPSAACAAA